MNRNRFLCGAAAILAVQCVDTAAKAADQAMPVKAAPQYEKVCSIYGPGFLYVPGSADACFKVGGYVRLQVASGQSGDAVPSGTDSNIGQGRIERVDNNLINYEVRAVTSLDMRFATEMGVARGYFRFGPQVVTPFSSGNTLFWDRGYIQFAGFTAGKQRSFFDIFSPTDGGLTYGSPRTTGDNDQSGVALLAYTFQFGNGGSASLSVEDPAGHNKGGVVDGSTAAFALQGIVTDNGLGLQSATNTGMQIPDIIGNLRLDQGWGYVGVSGALHQVAGAFYGAANSTNSDHPPDTFGFAAGIGGQVNVGTTGDTFGVNFVATQGAIGYAMKGQQWDITKGGGAGYGMAWAVDGIFDDIPGLGLAKSSIELTKAFSFNAAYQHIFNEKWKTSLYGGYVKVSYDDNAVKIINSHLPGAAGTTPCGVPVGGAVWPPLTIAPGGNSCSPDFSFWQIGTRTQYNPVTWLDLGIDVAYLRLNTAYKGTATVGANGAIPACTLCSIDDQNVITVMARAQINLWPGK